MFKFLISVILLVISSSLCHAQVTIKEYLKDQVITNIYVDNNKDLYILTSDTTYFFDGLNLLQREISIAEDAGLIDKIESKLEIKDDYNLKGTITTAAKLSEERTVFTNKTSRLYQIYQGNIQRYLIPDLDEQKLIINKVVSNDEYLIICTLNDGLYIWKQNEFVLDKINETNGLGTNNVNDAKLDDWGNLWIATDFGLRHLVYQDRSNNSHPYITVNKINLMYDEVKQEKLSDLNETENSLQFHFSARDYSGAEKISYEWKVEENQEWKPALTNVVSMSELEVGNYKFEVRATNGNGLYGYADPIPFAIKSEKLAAGWKYAFGGVGLLSLLWLWSLIRYNRFSKSSEEEKKKLRLENDLLKTEQKALQLQMNPHFVFNALNSIQGLIATNENRDARKYLNKFSSMMRSMLDQSRGDDINVKSEIKYLSDYLSLERMGKEDKFDFEVSRDSDVPDVTIPAMLIQPFVENAVVHGMKGLDRKGQINVKFWMDQENLCCEIDDNGVGRIHAASKSTHKSVALQVVKERLQKYSKFKNYNNLQIIDKKSEDGKNLGTKILITLPQL